MQLSAPFKTRENADLNQYWYSGQSISALCSGALELAGRCGLEKGREGRIAFLSTPSLYFSIPETLRSCHSLFDIDSQWASDPGFIRFDFNEDPTRSFPASALGAYDVVVIDPPFITEPVWRRYALAAQALLREGLQGLVICTTVAENEGLLRELFQGAVSLPFQPSIPNLVYQYNTFSNAYPFPFSLSQRNSEIPE